MRDGARSLAPCPRLAGMTAGVRSRKLGWQPGRYPSYLPPGHLRRTKMRLTGAAGSSAVHVHAGSPRKGLQQLRRDGTSRACAYVIVDPLDFWCRVDCRVRMKGSRLWSDGNHPSQRSRSPRLAAKACQALSECVCDVIILTMTLPYDTSARASPRSSSLSCYGGRGGQEGARNSAAWLRKSGPSAIFTSPFFLCGATQPAPGAGNATHGSTRAVLEARPHAPCG